MKILLVEAETDLQDVLAFYLESELGAEVRFAKSVGEAKDFFETCEDLSCVVSSYVLGDGTSEDVIRSLRSQMTQVNETPFILYGAYHPEKYPTFKEFKVDGFIPKWEIFEKLKAMIDAVVTGLKESLHPTEIPDYCRIRAKTVLKLGVLTCDFYLQLPQDRYVRVLRDGDMFESEDFERINSKNVEYLYIKTKDRSAFLQKLAQDLLQLSLLKAAPMEAVFEISTATLEVIADITQRFGFTDEAQAVAKANIGLVVKNIQKSKDLAPLFAHLNSESEDYIASHSVILSYIVCGISSLMGWKSDMTFYKLTMAAFLHDILLEDGKLALVQSVDEMNKNLDKFNPDEIKAILGHPEACAKLVQSVRDVPLDVDVIISQHHERPDGTGFPHRLSFVKISPLSAVFILAHELFNYYLSHPERHSGNEDVASFIRSLSMEFNKGYFKSLIAALGESTARKPSH